MTIYYVDNSSANANDSNAGTSAGSPFASLSAINALSLKAGDSVQIKAGTVYNVDAAGDAALKISASGTATKGITITSYGSGAAPIINNTSTAAYSDGIDLNNAHYVTISGIAFHSATQAAVNIGQTSSHITVSNNEMTNVGEGVQVDGTNNLITQNSMHDLHMVVNTAGIDGDDYGANGVVIGGSNNEISFNNIVNAKAASYDYGTDGGGIELFGNVSNVSIHDNYVAGSEGFIEAGGTAGSTVSNIQITNNVSYNNGNFIDLHNGGGAFAATFSNVNVNSNTVVNTNNASGEMSTIWLDAAATAAQVSVTNNSITLNNGDSVFNQAGSYHSGNAFDLQSSTTHLYNNWSNKLGAGESFANTGLTSIASGVFNSAVPALASVGAAVSAALQAVISGTSTGADLTASSGKATGSTSSTASSGTAPHGTGASGTGATVTGSAATSQTTQSIPTNAPTTVNTYDAKGALTRSVVTNADKSSTATTYGITGKTYTSEKLVYNSSKTLTESDRYTSGNTMVFKQTFAQTGTTTNTYSATTGALQNTTVAHTDGSSEYFARADGTITHKVYDTAGTQTVNDYQNASGQHSVSMLASGLLFTADAGVPDTITSFGGDTFSFSASSGVDAINKFQGGNAAGHDTINIDVTGVNSYSQLTSLITKQGSNTLIKLGVTSSVQLNGVAPIALTAKDFTFTHAPVVG